jgi:chaperone required for assembly of F1-ATPase
MSDKEKRRFRGLRAVGGEEGHIRTVAYDGLRDNKVPRWYETVDVEEFYEALNPVDPNRKAWTVTLDKRRIVTRNNKALVLPSEEMAMLVASDWETNTDEHALSLSKMPMMQLAAKAIDDVGSYRSYYERELHELLACDLTCIREKPTSAMGRAQIAEFDPLIEWLKSDLGLEFSVSHDTFECVHPQRTAEALSLFWETLDDFSFMAFHSTALATKSVVIALALWHDRLDVDKASKYVQLEEEVQSKIHGTIEGAHDLKHAVASCDVSAAACFLRTLPRDPPTKAYFDAMGDVETLIATRKKKEVDKETEREEYRRRTMAEFLLKQVADSKDDAERQSLRLFAMSLKEDVLPEGFMKSLEQEFEKKQLEVDTKAKKERDE